MSNTALPSPPPAEHSEPSALAAAQEAPKPERLLSLDAYRGAIMLLMASSGLGLGAAAAFHRNNAIWEFLAEQSDHATWVGCHLWDLIQPAFMVMVGVALWWWSVANRQARGQPFGAMFRHALGRSLLLVLLGVFLSSADGLNTKDAQWYSRRALELTPGEPEVWWPRSEALGRAGKLSEALVTVHNGLIVQPQNIELWNLQGRLFERTNNLDQAYLSFTKAIELSGAKPGSVTETQAKLYLERGSFLSRHGRLAEGAADLCLARNIPLRDKEAKPEQLDLSAYYNASLTESWHPGDGRSDLAAVPRGIQKLSGVAFDVRGLIQVGRESRSGEAYPKQIEGILVRSRCMRLHFLHSAIDGDSVKNGTQIGSYVIHYADGQHCEIPIVIGRDVGDWWSQPNEENTQFIVAWRGTNESSHVRGRTIRLFKSTWENPSPESTVHSLDVVSAGLRAAPFLFYFTLKLRLTIHCQAVRLRSRSGWTAIAPNSCLSPVTTCFISELTRFGKAFSRSSSQTCSWGFSSGE